MRPNHSRRKFLRDALCAGVALAGASLSHAPLIRAQPKGARRKLGVALLGLGKYSTEQLAPALARTQHCALRGIVTGSPQKVPSWQRQYEIGDRHVYDYAGLARIADDDAIDVVYIVVPTGLHAKYAIMAAEAGKHVWCEKPMAMSTRECEQIIAACRKNGVSLSIGYRMQHEPNTRTVMRYARERPYGAIEKVRALVGYAGGGGTSWRFQRALGGGALYDMGVYTINGIRYATGDEPVRVLNARQSTKRPEIFREVDETTEFELELRSGLLAYGRTSVGEDMNQLRVDCAHGWYELSPMQKYTGVKGRTSDGKALDAHIDSQQARQMDDDALAILEKRPLMVPGEEGLRDIRVVEAIRAAAERSAPVQI